METLFEEPRKCRQCDDVLTGRSDKLSCCLDHKNDYHNQRNRKKNKVFRRTDKQLHKNELVLEWFYNSSKGEKFIDQKPLTLLGFNSRYYTTTFRLNPTGETVYVLYHYAFTLSEKLQIKILKGDGKSHGI